MIRRSLKEGAKKKAGKKPAFSFFWNFDYLAIHGYKELFIISGSFHFLK